MTNTAGIDIAIIGMSGRFPGARTLDQFWRNLTEGVESIRFFSDEELLSSGVDAALLVNPNYVKARGVLDDVELFDSEFFGFTSQEAQATNPQQRLFLECAWEALERAGYPPSSHDLSVGVFATVGTNAYAEYCKPLVDRGAITPFQLALGNDKEHLSSRVSYKFNLTGPSVIVQTACSSSLVAVHLACQSLLAGDCDTALAGGAYVGFPPKAGYLFEEGNMYSRDGHCRSFDASASGTVRGDGVGVVALKRLADALTAHDHILAVVKGSAINNDGSVKVGYTAPGIAGQMGVIRNAQMIAGISADTIGYVECHGTGTILGDAVEIAALARVFTSATDRKGFCAVGSVKSSIGHLDVAGGIAGLIKTVLSLQHGLIPPSLHFTKPNPDIDFAESAFHVATTLEPWPCNARPRRAAVNSFGLGGTNAHIILEEAPASVAPARAMRFFLLPISAPTPTALDRVTGLLHEHLRSDDTVDLGDVAYTLQVGRKHFAHRRAVICRVGDHGGTCEALARPARVVAGDRGACRSVAFIFPGLGALSVDLGRDLYTSHAVFRDTIDRVSELLTRHVGIDLRYVLYPKQELVADANRQLARVDVAEAVLFMIDFALAKLWTQWGLRPEAMIGCGAGEYVAATLADVVSMEDAVVLLAARRRLAQQSATEATRLDAPYEAFRREIATVSFRPARIRYVSSVTGTWIESADVTDPEYWTRHARQPLLYGQGIQAIAAEPGRVLLEVGPGNALATFVRRQLGVPSAVLLASFPDCVSSVCVEEHLLTTAGNIWSIGIDLDWHSMSAPGVGRRVPLPTFPFERKRHWPDGGRHRVPAS